MEILPSTVAGWLGWVLVVVGAAIGLMSRTSKDKTSALDDLARVRKELLDEQEKRHHEEIERLRTDFKEQLEKQRQDAKEELETVRTNLRGDILRLDARAEVCEHERTELTRRLAETLATDAARSQEMEMMHRYYREIIGKLGGNVGNMQVGTITANKIETSVPGPQGEPGQDGERGEQGGQGNPGNQGNRGRRGNPGTPGKDAE